MELPLEWKRFRLLARWECLRRLARSILTCLAVTVGVTGVVSSPPLRAANQLYEVRQLAPHTFVWIPDDMMDQNGDPNFNRSGNVGFVITNDGVIVINTANNPFHAREVLYEIRQRTDLPVRMVIDTGSQGDEILGNEVFAEQRATIIKFRGRSSDALLSIWSRQANVSRPGTPSSHARHPSDFSHADFSGNHVLQHGRAGNSRAQLELR